MIGVYAITHLPSGRIYIGSSVRIEQRWQRHRQDLNAGVHHSSYLQRAWAKHGEAEFTFTLLLETTREVVRREERRLIQERQPVFNCMGTEEGPLKHSSETREKMSEAQRRIWEERRKAGTATLSEEHKANIAKAAKGREHTEASRTKMREAAQNRPPVSEETRKKLSTAGKQSQKGREFSPEHRAKLAAARKGRKMSDEQRAKIAASLQRAYAENRR